MTAPPRRAVIPAAGLGTRMRAVDPLRAKGRLPLAGMVLDAGTPAGCARGTGLSKGRQRH